MIWALLAVLAAADPEVPPAEGGGVPAAEAEDGSISLPEIEAPPSAMDDASPVSLPGEDGGLSDILSLWKDERRAVWSAGNYLRPALSVVMSEHANPAQLGVAAGRRWWQLGEGVKPSAQLGLTADFALAKGTGSYDVGLSALGGPWLRFVGLQVGPGVAASRWSLAQVGLPAAVGVDAHGALVVDLKTVHLLAAIAPRWLVTGSRASAEHPLGGFGDELLLRGGVGTTLGNLRIGFDLSRRWTAIGSLDRVGLNVRFRLL
jgi:hypothetical protein